MNDKQIEAFLAISEMGSMNRAAEKLYISQPALKKRMDILEEELGTALLLRSSEGCMLTGAGQVFLEEIKPIYAQMKILIEKVRTQKSQEVLKICTLPDISIESLDELLIGFTRKNTDLRVERIQLPTNQWLEAVLDRRADLCSCFLTEEKAEKLLEQGMHFSSATKRDKIVCVLSSQHPLAQKQKISMSELADYKVYAGCLLYYYSGLNEYAQKCGVNIECDESAGKRYEMIQHCEMGAAYIHPHGYARDLKPLSTIPISDFACYTTYVWRDKMRPVVNRFLRFYEATC